MSRQGKVGLYPSQFILAPSGLRETPRSTVINIVRLHLLLPDVTITNERLIRNVISSSHNCLISDILSWADMLCIVPW